MGESVVRLRLRPEHVSLTVERPSRQVRRTSNGAQRPDSLHLCANSYTVVSSHHVGSEHPIRLSGLAERGGEHAPRHPAAWRQPENRDVCGDGAGRQEPKRVGRVQVAKQTVEQNEIGYMTGSFHDRFERRARQRHFEASGEELLCARRERPRIGVGDEDVGRLR